MIQNLDEYDSLKEENENTINESLNSDWSTGFSTVGI